ncbi:hypothetical protein LTSERUB_3123 [Salmonella enterica subsp. enterica serovar Rubislaw str. A4-653]|uniref:Uncharacterized protein n=1 Tax=Salmonella enterica subsp. enterica serovar Rubislaw str. A4-653 TaxID=913081 RepID=G5QKC5_SALRU|nr:hypothetical protein LTSERUB_3123 [Salmonella enterica subsp. enterica serovar Rubislaw str. A4-653]
MSARAIHPGAGIFLVVIEWSYCRARSDAIRTYYPACSHKRQE